MSSHPNYYTELLHRRLSASPLTSSELEELHLHLGICLKCRYDDAVLRHSEFPQQAEALRHEVENSLTPDSVLPYLRDLAQARQAGRDLNGFQQLVWGFAQCDRRTLGRLRLLEADLALRANH